MPRKATIQAIFGSHTPRARKRPFFCPPVAMTMRTRPMIAIPVAINLGSVAMISRQTGIVSCNQRAHDPPMIAIPRPDDCRSRQLCRDLETAISVAADLRDTPAAGGCLCGGGCPHKSSNRHGQGR